MAGRRTIGWALDADEREALLRRFPPVYPQVIADHVTLVAGVGDEVPLPAERSGQIVGRADDGAGLQAIVVAIGGTTDRPDGSTYHVTWSLDPARGRKPVQSNKVLAGRGWERLEAPVAIRLESKEFRR